jgi:hypothetical protein
LVCEILYKIEEAFLPFFLEDIPTTESIHSHLKAGYTVEVRGIVYQEHHLRVMEGDRE